MRAFILRTMALASLPFFVIGLIIILPTPPRMAGSYFFTSIRKDSLLASVPSPRIIFVGGSSFSFGLNSRSVEDSLGINPINTGINRSIGVRYSLENVLRYAKYGDIIVCAAEYNIFNLEWEHGSYELLNIIDANKSNIKLLSVKQAINCLMYMRNFVISRLNPLNYLRRGIDLPYSVNGFNRYGDVYGHWEMENRHEKIEIQRAIDVAEYKPEVIEGIKRIAERLHEKGCVFLISYPPLREIQFDIWKGFIKKVEAEYHEYGFTVLGTPERYVMPDSLMFDTHYHLNKQGVERRTERLIEDIRHALD